MSKFNSKTSYLAVDKDGSEYVFSTLPIKIEDEDIYSIDYENDDEGTFTELPKGSILKLTGLTLTYDDKPVALPII